MKMRRAVAHAPAPRMTAESNGFAFRVATVGISAIAGFKIHQRKMARIDLDAAKLDGLLALEHWHQPHGFGLVAFV